MIITIIFLVLSAAFILMIVAAMIGNHWNRKREAARPAGRAFFISLQLDSEILHTPNIAVQREAGYRYVMTIGRWRSPDHAGARFPVNCYGIKALKTDLGFAQHRAFTV